MAWKQLRQQFETDVEAARDNTDADGVLFDAVAGSAALFATSGDVTRSDWHSYVERLRVPELYPGMLGLDLVCGCARRKQSRRLIAAGARDENFHVWPDMARPERHAIIFLEPLDARNAAAIGFDMSRNRSGPGDGAAWTNGTLATFRKVRLVQEIQGRTKPVS